MISMTVRPVKIDFASTDPSEILLSKVNIKAILPHEELVKLYKLMEDISKKYEKGKKGK